MRLALAAAAVAWATAGVAQEQWQRPQSYQVQSVGPVQVTLGVPQRVERVSIGHPGRWRELRDVWRDGVLTLHLSAADLGSGRALVVLDAPDWLDLDDTEAPEVVRLTVDGVTYAGEQISLGWRERSPGQVVMEVRDKRNPLDTASVQARCGGRIILPGTEGFTFTRTDPRHGVLELKTSQMVAAEPGEEVAWTLVVDDLSLDPGRTARHLTWALSPSITLEDGTVVTVDSSSREEGWRDWSVIFDGSHMSEEETTTSRRTWLSQEHGGEHWIRFDFPQPRTVRGIVLWWAYYQGWRTSVAYEVQTWDGERWVTQAQARAQSETGRSRHVFRPVTTTALRVLQPPHCGHPGRRDYMWLSEVEVIYGGHQR